MGWDVSFAHFLVYFSVFPIRTYILGASKKRQGSNLAFADLQVVFSKKQVEIVITCYFKQVKASHLHVYQPNHTAWQTVSILISQLLQKLGDLGSHCMQGNQNIGSER